MTQRLQVPEHAGRLGVRHNGAGAYSLSATGRYGGGVGPAAGASCARPHRGRRSVILDITVAVAADFRSARNWMTTQDTDTLHYAGTIDGLAGLVADIFMADVADGVTFIPRRRSRMWPRWPSRRWTAWRTGCRWRARPDGITPRSLRRSCARCWRAWLRAGQGCRRVRCGRGRRRFGVPAASPPHPLPA